jgi:phytoene dehydrogenase-like protein
MRVLDAVMPGIDRLVIGREIITPADLERRWGLSGGHIFHGEPAMDQSWVARPLLGWSRYATPIAGLFCGGAGTHPGGGLTGLSGLHAAGMVEEFLRSRRRSDGRSTPG